MHQYDYDPRAFLFGSLTLNSSCDFDTFVRILHEYFLSAQISYT